MGFNKDMIDEYMYWAVHTDSPQKDANAYVKMLISKYGTNIPDTQVPYLMI
jgi:hypothetical protein